MKNTLPLLLLIIVALGCNKFGPDTASTSNANSAKTNTAPATPVKVIDLLSTLGKSKDELKKMISATPTHEDPWLEYSLPEASLTFKFNKAKKADEATFRFKSISIGDASISGTDTAEQLGALAGIDLKGKTPKSASSLADTYEFEIGGKKSDVSFYHSNGKFETIMIDVD